jgi:hypothetical protein
MQQQMGGSTGLHFTPAAIYSQQQQHQLALFKESNNKLPHAAA